MIFCHKCGSKQLDDSMFCYKCGAKLVNENNTNSYNKTTERKNHRHREIEDAIPTIQYASCIVSGLLIVIELALLWFGNIVSLAGYGLTAGDIIKSIVSHFDIVIIGLDLESISTGTKVIFVILLLLFIGGIIGSIGNLGSALLNFIAKEYDDALEKICDALGSLAFNFGILIALAIFISNKTYKIVSMGATPIVCLSLSILTIIFIKIFNTKFS